MISRVMIFKGGALTAALALTLALGGCGGGSSSDEVASGPVPSFAGTYDVKMTKTADTCSLGFSRSTSVAQSVSQDGRNIGLLSNGVTLQGTVDPDNAGFSTSLQQTVEGIPATTTMVYRATATPGVFGAGFAVVATERGVTCKISYNGSATLRS